ncbi:hypothetical protein [Peptacetobacter sp.]|uniref:hypothetical protein n=1 Tax=Peptacetobacter sp. TaxID=2991975 RepID=UPI0026394345|nr:hypothetical protein [Peptacetobacter sp.]
MMDTKVFSLFKERDYSEIFENISIIGKKVDFFLECNTYDLELPTEEKFDIGLDIFEEAILKLLSLNFSDKKHIAETLCLTKDLINFIIIRLQEKKLVEGNGMDLTENGKEILCINEKNKDKKEVKFIKAKIFMLKQTKKILPYIHIGAFETELNESDREGCIFFSTENAGKIKSIKGPLLKEKKSEEEKLERLQTSTIERAINKYNRLILENEELKTIKYAHGWAINSTPSENVYFHMQAVVQDGNIDEILVSDGLIEDVDFIRKYVKNNFPGFVGNVKKNSVKNTIKSRLENDKDVERNNNKSKYYKLESIMSEINTLSYLYTISNEEDAFNQDEMQALKSEQKNFLLKCYSAIEHSLYYYDKENKLNPTIREVIKKNKNSKRNLKLIIQMAKKIGISEPQKYENLFNFIDDKRIRKMYNTEIPDMRIALSIAVLNAADNSNCQFIKLLKKRPELFDVINKFIPKRNELSHRTKVYELDKENNRKIYELLIDFINYLQPDYKFSNNINKELNISSISQEKLNAEIFLANELGTMYFYRLLPKSIRNEWMIISPGRAEYPNITEYINIMYRIMGDTLFYEIKSIKKDSKLNKKQILMKLKRSGIYSKSFETVKDVYIKNVLENKNETLGANAMVYLYYQEDKKIKELEKNKFVYTIERLVYLRGHGNHTLSTVLLTTDVKELDEIRDNMLRISRIIGES